MQTAHTNDAQMQTYTQNRSSIINYYVLESEEKKERVTQSNNKQNPNSLIEKEYEEANHYNVCDG